MQPGKTRRLPDELRTKRIERLSTDRAMVEVVPVKAHRPGGPRRPAHSRMLLRGAARANNELNPWSREASIDPASNAGRRSLTDVHAGAGVATCVGVWATQCACDSARILLAPSDAQLVQNARKGGTMHVSSTMHVLRQSFPRPVTPEGCFIGGHGLATGPAKSSGKQCAL